MCDRKWFWLLCLVFLVVVVFLCMFFFFFFKQKTAYEMRISDWSSDVCSSDLMHRDCINCQEQVCIKGEEHRKRNLEALRAETEYLLRQAMLTDRKSVV